MTSNSIVSSNGHAIVASEQEAGHRRQPPRLQRQRGVTLLELMVGLAIGLLVIAVAMGSLMSSRTISGSVSDASNIQQQAAYALRTIGLHIRQAGSLYLNPAPNPSGGDAYLEKVAFEAKATSADGKGLDFNLANDIISATDTTLTVGYRRYKEAIYGSSTDQSLMRNCLGGPADASTDQVLSSALQLVGTELRCSGNGATPQPVIGNVANFRVRYLAQNNGVAGNATLQYMDAAAVNASANKWAAVQGVEVCLVLYGNEPIDLPTGSSYTDCDGTTQVNMTSLTGERARRMHLVFRNVFQLRSQGLIGSVLPAGF